MRNLFENLLNEQKKNTKTKIDIVILEEKIQKYYPVISLYEQAGGYEKFYDLVNTYVDEGVLKPINNKKSNGMSPKLHKEYWLMPEKMEPSWSEFQILSVSDKLNMDRYRKNVELQTDVEWERIIRLHAFLCSSNDREYIGREERSYDIFGDEKFLGDGQGKSFLKRLNVSLKDLFIEQKGKPFQWTLINDLEEKNKVLIVENLNLYLTLIRFYMKYLAVRGYRPNIIIYGGGNHVPSSISYFYEIFPRDKKYVVEYVGDIDASGFTIYNSLKNNAPLNITLHTNFYRLMWENSKGTVPYENQGNDKKTDILKMVVKELVNAKELNLAEEVKRLWDIEERLPQEAINYEILLKENGRGAV